MAKLHYFKEIIYFIHINFILPYCLVIESEIMIFTNVYHINMILIQ